MLMNLYEVDTPRHKARVYAKSIKGAHVIHNKIYPNEIILSVTPIKYHVEPKEIDKYSLEELSTAITGRF